MKFEVGDRVKSFFGNGIIKEYLQKDMNLYKIELSEGEHKGKMPWFAEHELENIYEEIEEEIINPEFEGEEKYTTREQRIKNVEFALAINSIEGVPPSDDCKILLQDYINGEKEVDEIVKILIQKYKES